MCYHLLNRGKRGGKKGDILLFIIINQNVPFSSPRSGRRIYRDMERLREVTQREDKQPGG
jgi:hypothetical protein